jgi:hypothetical protein
MKERDRRGCGKPAIRCYFENLHALATLAQLKFNWRLAQDWQLISPGQFEHGVRLMEEVGRLLGAWLKTSWERSAATVSEKPRASPAPNSPSGD